MKISSVLVTAAMLAIAVPAAPAFAHDSDYTYNRHARDHRQHRSFHSEVSEAHARAHEEWFDSRREHRAYHRALRNLHGEFHDDHPGTRHDHYNYNSYNGYTSYGGRRY
jgi:hypothetical protein